MNGSKASYENSNSAIPTSDGSKNNSAIAIVGISFQFPDSATTSHSFWSMLADGRCTSKQFPISRLNGEALFHPDPRRNDSVPLKGGHFLDTDISAFDAPFFSISEAEATAMDPQSRHLLETTYKALENAGVSMEAISNSNTSVFTGNLSDDYRSCIAKDPEHSSRLALVSMPSLLSGRLSWFFNLKGTSLTIDTACSSSLVALDLGCQSLLSGASDMSIVTGCSLIFTPDLYHALSNMGMLSSDSRSYSFDQRANGYGRGEGIAALILKRVTTAIDNGDTIRAVIRSTGTNQDGRTPGVTQPSISSQLALIKETYRKHGLSMVPTRYFEAHGTGTPVGDPIEASAIGLAFQGYRSCDDPLYVGSVKSNIGHAEGASGLAGVIKAIFVLEKGLIPPIAGFEKANQRIDSDHLNITFPISMVPWPTLGLRRVSVNSFGASGTNAHAILDDTYHYLSLHGMTGNHNTTVITKGTSSYTATETSLCAESTENSEKDLITTRGTRLVVFSAATKNSLEHLTNLFDDHLRKEISSARVYDDYLDNFVYTLAAKRNHLRYRCSATVGSSQQLESLTCLLTSPVLAAHEPQIAFIFTGQGAQWPGMGKELLQFPIFQSSILQADDYLKDLGFEFRLIDLVSKEASSAILDRPCVAQVMCAAIQIGIVELYRSIGLLPYAVVGHSSGELAAAFAAGAISRFGVLKLAYWRGVLSEVVSTRKNGGMLAIGLGESDAKLVIKECASKFSIPELTLACINSPQSVTVSGSTQQLETLTTMLSGRGIFHRRLKTNVAYHSPSMSIVSSEYASMVKYIEKGDDGAYSAVMISSTKGQIIEPEKLRKVEYWIENMVNPVRFSSAVALLCGSSKGASIKKLDGSHRKRFKIDAVAEIGPHSALKAPVLDTMAQVLPNNTVKYYSTLVRGTAATDTVMKLVGATYCLGFKVDIHKLNSTYSSPKKRRYKVLVDLPEYPFDHSRKYWIQSRISEQYRFRQHRKLDLLGKPVVDWNPLEPRWQNTLKISELPWALDHKINGAVIYPAAGMMAMAIEAINQISDPDRSVIAFCFTDVYFQTALLVPQTAEGIETQLSLRPSYAKSGRDTLTATFQLCSIDAGIWRENCRGSIRLEYSKQALTFSSSHEKLWKADKYRERHETAISLATEFRRNQEFYRCLSLSGYTFGPAFCIMDNVSFSDRGGFQTTADVKCFEWHDSNNSNQYQNHVVHPVTLDGIFQTCLAVFCRGGAETMPTAVPIEIESFWISKLGLSWPKTASVKSRCSIVSSDNLGYQTEVVALDKCLQEVLVDVKGLKLKFVDGTGSQQSTNLRKYQTCYNLRWRPDVQSLDLNDSLSTPNDIYKGVIRKPLSQDSVAAYLSLCYFKWPGLQILIVLTDDCLTGEGYFSFLIKKLALDATSYAMRPIYLTLLNLSDVLTADVLKSLDIYPEIIFSCLSMSDGHIDCTNESYHVVIIPETLPAAPQYQSLHTSIGKLLCPDGIVMFLAEDVVHVGNEDTTQLCFLQDRSKTNRGQATINGDTDSFIEQTSRANLSQYVSAQTPMDATVEANPRQSQLIQSKIQSERYILFIEDTSGYQKRIASQLVMHLKYDTCIVCNINSLSTTIESQELSRSVCIFFMELEKHFLVDTTQQGFATVQAALASARGLLWLSSSTKSAFQQPALGMIDGLSRVLRAERQQAVIVTAALETDSKSVTELIRLIDSVLKRTNFEPGSQNYEPAYRQINGVLNISRLCLSPSSEQIMRMYPEYKACERQFGSGLPLRLSMASPGLLDSLHFIEDNEHYDKPMESDEVEIKVQMIGLNFKDLLLALGRIGSKTFGVECAGTIARAGESSGFQVGTQVCLLTPDAYTTFTRAKARAVARVPSGVPLSHAATIPAQFTTAYYAICNMAALKRNETILIHSGAGGTGQAAIQIARYFGGEVFVTVGTEEKRLFLIEHYGIEEDHIFYSRDQSFAEGIMRMTKNRGVDVVLNSLSGESLLASWNLIAPYGRFIELGKKDILENTHLPMRPFQRGATIASLETSVMAADQVDTVRTVIEKLLDMLTIGAIRIVYPLQILPLSKILDGMRMLQDGKMMGKVVFEIRDDTTVPCILRTKPSFFFDSNRTYVIAGGSGGIGRSIARWMVFERGARHVVLLSRSGASKPSVQQLILEAQSSGARIEAPTCDITNYQRTKEVMDALLASMPRISGCVQASMVLRDGLFANMSHVDWEACVRPKTAGSWNLHSLLPKGLDFFILLSSAAGVLGSPGQGNYAAGNSFMDALAHYRISQGEKAVSIDLGVMLDDGVLANDNVLKQRLLNGSLLSGVSRREFHALLDFYCDPTRPILSHTDCQVLIGLKDASEISINQLNTTPLKSNPFYGHYLRSATADKEIDEVDSVESFRRQVIAAEDVVKAGAAISQALVEKLVNSLPHLQDGIDLSKPIHHYGVDSLLAIELRAWFLKEFGADVPVFDILGEGTFITVGVSAASKSSLRALTSHL